MKFGFSKDLEKNFFFVWIKEVFYRYLWRVFPNTGNFLDDLNMKYFEDQFQNINSSLKYNTKENKAVSELFYPHQILLKYYPQ